MGAGRNRDGVGQCNRGCHREQSVGGRVGRIGGHHH